MHTLMLFSTVATLRFSSFEKRVSASFNHSVLAFDLLEVIDEPIFYVFGASNIFVEIFEPYMSV